MGRNQYLLHPLPKTPYTFVPPSWEGGIEGGWDQEILKFLWFLGRRIEF